MPRISALSRPLAVFTVSTLFAAACTTGGESTTTAANKIQNRFEPANLCLALKAGENYIEQTDG
ncbi:MAG: hypothetical protein OXT49_05230, partial [Gammaproteobacteria bacterium]|nr:hypothetical protein [Gammaproteobacteria bacterium]